jgi:hypothetical protein
VHAESVPDRRMLQAQQFRVLRRNKGDVRSGWQSLPRRRHKLLYGKLLPISLQRFVDWIMLRYISSEWPVCFQVLFHDKVPVC